MGRTQIGLMCEIFRILIIFYFDCSVTVLLLCFVVFVCVICLLYCGRLIRYYNWFTLTLMLTVKQKKRLETLNDYYLDYTYLG